MDFEQMLELLRNPPEDGLPETIYDDMGASHASAIETREAKIAQMTADMEASIQERDSEISRLKSANYDAMMSASAGDNGEREETEDDTDDDEETGIEELFD